MGLDFTGAIVLAESKKLCNNFSKVLMIGRQELHTPIENIKVIFEKYNLQFSDLKQEIYSENIFYSLGAKEVDSLDASNHENANIIQDMNYPISNVSLLEKYDFIFDGGAIEHVFNVPQYIQNIIDLLSIDGIYACITCNNNFSGHGFYQFSPEVFNRCFEKKYGMQLINSYICDSNNIQNTKILSKIVSFRDTSILDTKNPVYICVIARKVSNGIKITKVFPQQFSYEELMWK